MAGTRRNLEVKAVDPDPQATLQAALGRGAEDQGELRQRDIHLDRVADLGHFVEIEAVAAAPAGLEVERDLVEELRGVLGVTDEHLVPIGDADLLARRGRQA